MCAERPKLNHSPRAEKRLAMQRIILVIAGCVALLVTSEAPAQTRCRVMDPTGTPLNMRTGPNGTIVGTLPNGTLVTVTDHTVDAKGRPWVHVVDLDTGEPYGWVFREFIACF
jgi:uncharacterized protein YraI